MHLRHLMITLLGVALICAIVTLCTDLIEAQQAAKHRQLTVDLSKQETARLRILVESHRP